MFSIEKNFRFIFDALPGNYLVLRPNPPHFTIVDFNRTRALSTMSNREAIGKDLFEVFTDDINNPAATGVANLRQSLMTVMKEGRPHTMALQRYDLKNPDTGRFEERWWLPVNIPVYSDAGQMVCIIHAVDDVTEVQRLQQSEVNILESIDDGFLSLDRDWKVLYWNKRSEEIFGIAREQILGKPFWRFITEESVPVIREKFDAVLHTGHPLHFEKYYRAKKIWLQVSAYPSANGLTAIMVDNTEKKRSAAVIEQNEKRFRALVENISEGIALLTAAGRLQEISASGTRLLGYTAEELVGKDWQQFIHPQDKAGWENTLEHVLQKESNVSTCEHRFCLRGGSYIWIEATLHNLLLEENIHAIVVNCRDVTERKLYAEQLKASEAKYRDLFNNNPGTILIWTLDDLAIREVNSAAVELYHYSRAEFLQLTALDIRPREEQEKFLDLVIELKKTRGARSSGTWLHRNKNGELMYMFITFYRITYDGHDAVLALGTNTTEKVLLEKRLDEERRKKQREITEAVITAQENERADLGRELHDNINQILTTTRLYLEYARDQKGDTRHLIQQSMDYISHAIKEIRQLSGTLMPPSGDEVSLKQSLEELFRNVRSLDRIKLNFLYDIADEARLDQSRRLAIFRIIQEQLNNVIKHAQATDVFISVSDADQQINLEVEDNGIGFDTSAQSKGLGLKNIASRTHLFSGRYEITSHPGEGTRLQVILPA